MNGASPALRVARLAKQYAGGQGVSDVSFAVEPGQITGFIGVNGAGKSTTLRCILGLSEPDAGDIEIFGEEEGGIWLVYPESKRRSPKVRAFRDWILAELAASRD